MVLAIHTSSGLLREATLKSYTLIKEFENVPSRLRPTVYATFCHAQTSQSRQRSSIVVAGRTRWANALGVFNGAATRTKVGGQYLWLRRTL